MPVYPSAPHEMKFWGTPKIVLNSTDGPGVYATPTTTSARLGCPLHRSRIALAKRSSLRRVVRRLEPGVRDRATALPWECGRGRRPSAREATGNPVAPRVPG